MSLPNHIEAPAYQFAGASVLYASLLYASKEKMSVFIRAW
jgi:hypothetical protein